MKSALERQEPRVNAAFWFYHEKNGFILFLVIKQSDVTVPVLSVDKVMELLDVLGDQVVDALEAYELFADRDAKGPRRMTLLGLLKALLRLWSVNVVLLYLAHRGLKCVF